ncbi:MAG: hypothetical protein Q7S14_00850 [bacterium]|nr:hypothetical protein [bacterium]
MIKHLIDFIALGIILGLSLAGLYFFRHQTDKQIIITVLLGVSYILWGVFHHLHIGNLKFQVIMEYISISALVVFILTLFLLRV